MWRNILCHAFMQIIMLLVLIFVLPGWLVHNYEVLQHPLAFTKEAEGNKLCAGFYQKKEDDTRKELVSEINDLDKRMALVEQKLDGVNIIVQDIKSKFLRIAPSK